MVTILSLYRRCKATPPGDTPVWMMGMLFSQMIVEILDHEFANA